MGKRRKRRLRQVAILLVCLCLLAGCGLPNKYEVQSPTVSQEVKKSRGETKKEKKAASQEEEMPVTETESETPQETERETESEAAISWERAAYAGDFAYMTLQEEEQQVYYEVLTAILEHQESVAVSTLDTEVLERAYKAVSADYGGLFWVSGYVYTQHTRNGEPVSMEFAPKYTLDAAQREELQAQIDTSVEELLAGVSITDSDYTKAKYVFEILVQNIDYDASVENSQNIISAFLNRATVCQGYACATQYLLRLLGIQSVIVTGIANGESHAWNLVRLDGDYYYMDTTWGNSRYLDHSSQMEKYVNYNYLAVTSEEISRTHTLDNSFSLPECISMEDNYFVKENRYFSEWNPDAVGAVLAETWNAGGGDVSVKFSSLELYEQALDYFIVQQYIADYCANISSIYYIEDTELFVLTFHF